jgi:hypothetical protein
MAEVKDFMESRGIIYYIFIYIFLWYAVDNLIHYVFERYDIENKLYKSITLFVVFLIVLALGYCRHKKCGPKTEHSIW